MRRALSQSLLVLLFTVLPLGDAEARQDGGGLEQFIGQTVVDVRFEIEGQAQSSPVLISNVEVKAGQPFRREDWRASIDRLAQRFDDVVVLGSAVPGGLQILFRLTPRHPISRVAFDFTAPVEFSVSDLDADFRRQFGSLPTSARVPAAEESVRRLLVDRGFLEARVTSSTIATHDPDRATLVFAVTPGPLARVGNVEVRLRGSAPMTRETVLARAGLTAGGPYRRRALQTAMVALQDDLRSQGYYESIAASSDEPAGTDLVNVTIVIDSGRRVELRFAGDSLPGSIGRLDDLVPVKRLGSADLSLLEDAQRNIEARLKNAGYKDAKVILTPSDGAADSGPRVITFTFQRGPRYRIDRVVLPEGLALPASQIARRLDLPPNSPFSAARVTAGITRLIVDYHQQGYARVAVTPVFEDVVAQPEGDTARVVVHLSVDQGPKYHVASVRFDHGSNGAATHVPDAELQAVMALRAGAPYVATTLRQDQINLQDFYRNRGYRSATAAIPPPTFTEKSEAVSADVVVRIDEGVQVLVGSIVVVGNEKVSEGLIREEITLREGQPFAESARIESLSRLTQLNVFGSVRIEEEPRLSGERDATIVISVAELPRTTAGVGGGLEGGRRTSTNANGLVSDALDLAPRGLFEIGRRGLGGRNRSVNLFTRVAIKRASLSEDIGYGFSEYRLTGTYRERRAFRTDTDLLFGVTGEQAIRTNFSFRRQSANAEVLKHVTPAFSLSGRYVLDETELFDESIPEGDQFDIDRLFPQVRLSIFGGGLSWDRRNTPFAPSLGTLMTADVELAARSIGSEVGYAKAFMQVSALRPLGAPRRTVLAVRMQMGLARGFERSVAQLDENGAPVLGPDGEPLRDVVADIPASQRFFAGGGTSVRGFQLDRLGAPDILTPDGLSNGGNALLILNAELRRIVKQVYGRSVAVVGFVDAGNVFRRVRDLRLVDLRSAVGFGVRYDSPIGPLRLDFGFKTSRFVFRGGRERGWEYHLSIGEAF
jgi:outer membrane protein insertion porin family